MKISKAIEILSDEVKHPYSAKKMAHPDAITLGIEALKRIQDQRQCPINLPLSLLPGETTK